MINAISPFIRPDKPDPKFQGIASVWLDNTPPGAPVREAALKRWPAGLVIEVTYQSGVVAVVSCPATYNEDAPPSERWKPDLFTVAIVRPEIGQAIAAPYMSLLRSGGGR